jgi:hypothetical protein
MTTPIPSPTLLAGSDLELTSAGAAHCIFPSATHPSSPRMEVPSVECVLPRSNRVMGGRSATKISMIAAAWLYVLPDRART